MGGLIGAGTADYNYSNNTITVKNCSADVQVTCGRQSGGFIGSTYFPMVLEDCSAVGDLYIRQVGRVRPSNIGGFVGEVSSDIVSCHSGVVIHFDYGPNQMGCFAGEMLEYDILNCTIDKEAVLDGWYMAGWRWFQNVTVDVTVVE